MGRFYKATPGQFIDNKMFETPFNEIATTIGKIDKDISENEETALALHDTLKLNSIKGEDTEAARQKIKGYSDQIESITKELHSDPLKFRQKSSKIRELSRAIKNDWETGEASQIQSSYDTRQNNLKTMQDAWKKNPELFNYEDINKLMAKTDESYKGFRQGYQANMLKPFQNIEDVENIAKGYKADSKKIFDVSEKDGKYISSVDKTKEVKPEDIRKDISRYIAEDEKLMGYYKQQRDLGNMSVRDIQDKIKSTVDRLASKYGYKETERGVTGVKDTAASVARAKTTALSSANVNQPTFNNTPGGIYDQPLTEKYAPIDPTTGEPMPADHTFNGLKNVVSTIEEKQGEVSNTVAKIAGDLNIPINAEMQTAIASGDFSVLKGAVNASGQKIDPALLYTKQQEYQAYLDDKKIVAKKMKIAKDQVEGGMPVDDFLFKHSGKSIVNTSGKFQDLGIVNKQQGAQYTKAVKEWRDELNTTKSWYHAPLKYDANDIKNLPAKLQQLLKDGTSLVDLQKLGYVNDKKPKGSKISVNDRIVAATMNVDITQTENTAKGYFQVNGSKAKPMLSLGDDGKAITQFEIVVDGSPIKVYMSEGALGSDTITRYMDMDKMKAASRIQEAFNEGVINEEPFLINGLEFTKVGKDNLINGVSMNMRKAISDIAGLNKRNRTNFLN